MIKLHLGIGDGDVNELVFKTSLELTDYIEEIKSYKFNSVWLASGGGEYAEIIITENIDIILLAIAYDHFRAINLDKNSELHLHEYESYQTAYSVANHMREGNPKCYEPKV